MQVEDYPLPRAALLVRVDTDLLHPRHALAHRRDVDAAESRGTFWGREQQLSRMTREEETSRRRTRQRMLCQCRTARAVGALGRSTAQLIAPALSRVVRAAPNHAQREARLDAYRCNADDGTSHRQGRQHNPHKTAKRHSSTAPPPGRAQAATYCPACPQCRRGRAARPVGSPTASIGRTPDSSAHCGQCTAAWWVAGGRRQLSQLSQLCGAPADGTALARAPRAKPPAPEGSDHKILKKSRDEKKSTTRRLCAE